MRLFYQPKIKEGLHFLDEEESRHAIKVLRLKEGDDIRVLDGVGGTHIASITSANHKKCEFKVKRADQASIPKHHIHIAIAPTKNADRIEWFVEKTVEIGVQEISFVFCDNSERKHFKIDRIVKKAISAMKQSLGAYLPIINEPIKLADFYKKTDISNTEVYIAYVDHDNPDLLLKIAQPKNNYLVLIGPEGDFSNQELEVARENKFKKVSLGQSRLRTETAGIVACHILNIVNGK